MVNTHARGIRGEDLAVDFLQKKGYHIVKRNYHFERGEIDVIAEHGGLLVFVEVKARRSGQVGLPEDSITPSKRDRMLKVAEGYLMQHRLSGQDCRFDVVAIEWLTDGVQIRHRENVFDGGF